MKMCVGWQFRVTLLSLESRSYSTQTLTAQMLYEGQHDKERHENQHNPRGGFAEFVTVRTLQCDAAVCIPATRPTELNTVDAARQHLTCKMAQLNRLPSAVTDAIAKNTQGPD